MNRILVVDDEKDMRWLLSNILKEDGYTIYEAEDCGRALNFLKKDSPPDLILLDLRIPGEMDGIDLLKEIKTTRPEIQVIILTAYGNIGSAVEAIKLGAYDYLTKPFENERLRLTIKRALESQKLTKEIFQLKNELKRELDLESIMGGSPEIKKIFEQINKVSDTNFTVLIEGESGTGKEVVANAIHRASSRGNASFIAVDCGAIPDTLIESELFGYEKGAFTGADREKKGQFELANNGTIFLDEIGNLPYHVQNKLLRMIQERKIQKLGGKQPFPIDVRIIVASNIPLAKLEAEGKLRSDIYYRLNEFKIELPPLRKRIEDIPFLAKKFLEEGNMELQKNVKGLQKDSLTMLINHHWPGNVRELKNVIKRAVLLAESMIEPSHLIFDNAASLNPPIIHEEKIAEGMSLREITKKVVYLAEKEAIEWALNMSSGNKSKAAKVLRVDYKTLLSKIKEYDIRYGIDCMESVP
ncbi:MAG: sigma-54-dependent Fis family transcriptional regulator [Deltaproteobacteria bacterium]|nr:sigma-54-dependent Fis family transcriptional regulator [Deltaproteobacteria bacterium]